MDRWRKSAAVLALCAVLAACSGANQAGTSSADEDLTIRQPTVAELSRFLPGGVRAHGIPLQAPLPCGGTVKSVRRATTAIKGRDSLLAISVSQYEFASRAQLDAYIAQVSTLPSGASAYCVVDVPKSGDHLSVGGPAYLSDDGYYVQSATTQHGPGSYDGTTSHSTTAYLVHGKVVSVVQVNRQPGYADEAFMGALLGTLETPGGPTLETDVDPIHSASVTAVLRAEDHTDLVGGVNSAVSNALCPVAIIDGTPYNIYFERQLPHAIASGVYVPGDHAGTSTLVRWGSTVTLEFDKYSTIEDETAAPCSHGTTGVRDYVDVVSMRPAN